MPSTVSEISTNDILEVLQRFHEVDGDVQRDKNGDENYAKLTASVEIVGIGEDVHVEKNFKNSQSRTYIELIHLFRVDEQPKSDSFLAEAMKVTPRDLKNDPVGRGFYRNI